MAEYLSCKLVSNSTAKKFSAFTESEGVSVIGFIMHPANTL